MAPFRPSPHEDPSLPRLRAVCLALPEAVEVEAWGRPTFRAGAGQGRMFALYSGNDEHEFGVVFRTDPDERPALVADRRVWVPSSFGSRGWVGLDLGAAPVDWQEVGELMETSYRQVALKRMLGALDP